MDWLEWALLVCTILVLVGVVLEGSELYSEYKQHGWWPVLPKLGFGLLVIGLAGETLISPQVERRHDEELVATSRAISARTISASAIPELKNSLKECNGAINVQGWDVDWEAQLFSYSLNDAFEDAGFATSPAWLPTLGNDIGADISIYVPTVGDDRVGQLINSNLYKTFTGLGFTLTGVTKATNATDHQMLNINEESKYEVEPTYCILRVLNRPPQQLSGQPYRGHFHPIRPFPDH